MPELPEVETVKEGLMKRVRNKEIATVQVLWNNTIEGIEVIDFINNLKGQKINDITRRGKWLVFYLDDYVLLSHLRMEGKYFTKKLGDKIVKHEHVIFNFTDGTSLRYQDTRKFGKMHLIPLSSYESYPVLQKLGLEPWDDRLDNKYLIEKYAKKTLPIKTVLLDQTIITGIGNIYADEILFQSNISPLKPANKIVLKEAEKIILNTREVLAKAVADGGTTIRSYVSEEGIEGRFQNDLFVHTKKGQPCRKCGSIVEKITVGGRGTYFCPKCQKLK